MKKFLILCLVILVVMFLLFASLPGKSLEGIRGFQGIEKAAVKTSARAGTVPDSGKIPLYFIPNKGQVNEKAEFYARTPRYTLWMTKKGLVFDSFYSQGACPGINEGGSFRENSLAGATYYSPGPPAKVKSFSGGPGGRFFKKAPLAAGGNNRLDTTPGRDFSRLIFLNANPNPEMMPVEITRHKVNYFIGKDPSRWQRGIPTSKAVLYKNIYKNIDLKVYGNERQIEYDWIVRPGGEPGDIRLEYKNIKAAEIDNEWNLVIETRLGKLVHRKPVSYQRINGEKVNINSHFERISKNIYGFRIKAYDRNYELIIDPVVALNYSTYLGGSGDENSETASVGKGGLAIDSTGNIYVTGCTMSANFPTKKCFQCQDAGGEDVFVTKFKPDGSGLIYSTYLGGSGNDEGLGIVVTVSGYVYVTGMTESPDFPAANNYGGNRDAFVGMLDIDGSLKYIKYLGGNQRDEGHGIAVDGSNNVYVTGNTQSPDFPLLNPYQDAYAGNRDAFVSIFNSNSLELTYSTYLGGNSYDWGQDIVVDGPGSFYVTGFAFSSNFPTKNPFQGTKAGAYDGFVTKFKPDGSGLIYSTYIGGEGFDYAIDIEVDGPGSAYVSGHTASAGFPLKNAFQDVLYGSTDAFVTRLNPDGSDLIYSTYLGGTGNEYYAFLAIDNSNHVYLSGRTYSNDFPTKNAYQAALKGISDAFAVKFGPDGSELVYSTYLGGSGIDLSQAIKINSPGNVYIAGCTSSTDFPAMNPFQGYNAGGYDAFVTVLSFAHALIVQSTPDTGVPITVNPDDINGNGDGSTEFTRTYNPGETVTLTAPGTFNNKVFYKWAIDGFDNFNRTIQVTMDNNHTVTAVYQLPPPTWILTVKSKPNKGVPITVSPPDINGDGNGETDFTRTYNPDDVVTLTAPMSFKSKVFYRWTIDGIDNYNRLIQVTMDNNHTVTAEYRPPAVISLNRTRMYFGADTVGTTTGEQTFFIGNSGGSALDWTLTAGASWLNYSPAGGTDNGKVTVSVNASGLSEGTYNGAITVNAPEASNSPQTIDVTLTVYNPDDCRAPFGFFETPQDGAYVYSSIPVTGWALDDIEVESVKIYREEGKDLVYIGDAVFVEGARPDVELAYPAYPGSYRAGWGYMMLTNFLPGGGNGTFVIHAAAEDKEGNKVTLGKKTIICDNAHAVKPFGALDTPAQGGTASGASYVNFGWVLTPRPNTIPIDGSTINVWIDGVNIGNPVYNKYRADIAVRFPGYANSSGAVGYFNIDTTQYENGVHTIQWTALDSAGNVDGIGSRYFMIQNTGDNRTRETFAVQCSTFNVDMAQIPLDHSRPVRIKKGIKENIEYKTVYPNQKGIATIRIKELQRMEIHVAGPGRKDGKGFQLVGEQLRPLPVGSTFDAEKGIFYWLPGPGFIGTYRLVFIEQRPDGQMMKKFVNIKIIPGFTIKRMVNPE